MPKLYSTLGRAALVALGLAVAPAAPSAAGASVGSSMKNAPLSSLPSS